MAIETLNIDGTELKVAELSQEVQRLVQVYEVTHNKRVDVETEHAYLSAALRQLSTDITAAVRKSQEGETTAEADVPSTPSAA